jgi:hypothetical protein
MRTAFAKLLPGSIFSLSSHAAGCDLMVVVDPLSIWYKGTEIGAAV